MIKRILLIGALTGVTGQAVAIPTADVASTAAIIAQMVADAALQAAMEELNKELAEKGIEVDEELAEKARELAEEQFKQQREEDSYGWTKEIGGTELYSNEKLNKQGSGYINKNKNDIIEALDEKEVTQADRDKHGLNSEQEYMQKSFDKEIKYRKMLDEAYALNNERLERINALKEEVKKAKTPKEKADIELVIQAEQTAIMSETLRLQTINDIKNQESRLEQYRLEDGIYEEFRSLE